MLVYIFIYNVVYIKSDFSKLFYPSKRKLILIGSNHCLKHLTFKNKECFEHIHQISRDFHKTNHNELRELIKNYVDKYGAENIRLLTNEDSAHLDCAILRAEFYIPGVTENQILPFVNKIISKQRLENLVRMPKFTQFNKVEYLKNQDDYLNSLADILGFPMFTKPIDLVSSVETHYISDMNNLKLIAEKIVKHEYEFEVDEFIDGELVHCDAMIIDNQIKFFMAGKCSFALARFFDGKPVGSIPINNMELFNKIKEFCLEVFKKLKCFSGAYHMEVFLKKHTQEIVFLEIGARTGGALITNVYEKLFNINIEETNYKIQMGIIKDVQVSKRNIFAGFLNFPTINGYLEQIQQPNINIDTEFITFVKSGDLMKKAENLLDISCSIIFWSNSYEKVEKTFEFLKSYNPIKIKLS